MPASTPLYAVAPADAGPAAQPVRRRRFRIGFLYNHEATHQVAHSAPVIPALLESMPDTEVVVIITSEALESAVRCILGPIAHHVAFVRLTVPAWHRPVLRFAEGFAPLGRVDHLLMGRGLLATFDALVVTERTSLLIKQFKECSHVKLIYISHGSGDRSIGFKADMGRFDRVLVSGTKLRDRLVAQQCVDAARLNVVGYPKFDTVGIRRVIRLFDNDRKTVLYCPHFEPRLSSWYVLGRQVLEYFFRSDRYNLIFAPHVMLFRRRLHVSLEGLAAAWRGTIARKYVDARHILIDLGSRASTDMTYTDSADIYLGDASSQVYEFLRAPRPCIHLNSHRADWRVDPNYRFWGLGRVIDRVADLGAALDNAEDDHAGFLPAQTRVLSETFDSADPPAAPRAAAVIRDVMLAGATG